MKAERARATIFIIHKENGKWVIYNREGKQAPPFDSAKFYKFDVLTRYAAAVYVVRKAMGRRGF